MVSPYLNRRLRSLDEVLLARDAGAQPADEAAARRWHEDPARTDQTAAAPAPPQSPPTPLETPPALPPPADRRAA